MLWSRCCNKGIWTPGKHRCTAKGGEAGANHETSLRGAPVPGDLSRACEEVLLHATTITRLEHFGADTPRKRKREVAKFASRLRQSERRPDRKTCATDERMDIHGAIEVHRDCHRNFVQIPSGVMVLSQCQASESRHDTSVGPWQSQMAKWLIVHHQVHPNPLACKHLRRPDRARAWIWPRSKELEASQRGCTNQQ